MSKLIIFDCDGVLVDSESITNTVLSNYLNEFGLDFTPQKALELFRGGALQDCIDFVRNNYGVELPENFPSSFRHRMKVAFEKDLEPVKGVKELLDSLKGRAVCVASNGPIEKMDTTLKVTGLKPYFNDHVFSAYQIQKWKPEPDLFLHAAKTMGFEPSDCVVIEDSPRGVEAATKAGMKSYGFAVYGNEDKLKANGAEVFHSMQSLMGKL